MSMTDAEIKTLIENLKFGDVRESDAVINLPFHVPKALFMEKITLYAQYRGWHAQVQNMETGEMQDNQHTALQYVCDMIRDDLKSDFANFFISQIEQQAKEQGQLAVKQVFGEN